jgi:hypothetical protein
VILFIIISCLAIGAALAARWAIEQALIRPGHKVAAASRYGKYKKDCAAQEEYNIDFEFT